MGKNVVEGVVKVDPSKGIYDGRVSVYRDGALLGILDPFNLDRLKILERADGKKIKFKPDSIERKGSEVKFYVSRFSLE